MKIEHREWLDPTPEERKLIRALQRLAKTWPKSLWLYSASGRLHVMRCGSDGKPVMTELRDQNGCPYTDPDYSLATIDIPNDGGDW